MFHFTNATWKNSDVSCLLYNLNLQQTETWIAVAGSDAVPNLLPQMEGGFIAPMATEEAPVNKRWKLSLVSLVHLLDQAHNTFTKNIIHLMV